MYLLLLRQKRDLLRFIDEGLTLTTRHQSTKQSEENRICCLFECFTWFESKSANRYICLIKTEDTYTISYKNQSFVKMLCTKAFHSYEVGMSTLDNILPACDAPKPLGVTLERTSIPNWILIHFSVHFVVLLTICLELKKKDRPD